MSSVPAQTRTQPTKSREAFDSKQVLRAQQVIANADVAAEARASSRDRCRDEIASAIVSEVACLVSRVREAISKVLLEEVALYQATAFRARGLAIPARLVVQNHKLFWSPKSYLTGNHCWSFESRM
jgi:hypothetical protein